MKNAKDNKKVTNIPENIKRVDSDRIPKEKGERNAEKKAGNSSVLNRLQKISLKLFTGLLIPVVLIACYGAISYRKSERAIINNYEHSAADTLNAVSDFLDFGFSAVNQKSLELILDPSVTEFFSSDSNANSVALIKSADLLNERIIVAESTNSFISGIHIFGSSGKGISTDTTIVNDIFQSFVATDIGKRFEENGVKELWIGAHKELDDALSEGNAKYNTDNYALSMIRKQGGNKGFVVIDISSDKINEMFSEYGMGEGSILGLISGDGREILDQTAESDIFTPLSYYQEALASEIPSGYSYESYENETYLFLYSKLTSADGMVCALIPKSAILKEVSGIKLINIAFVVAACIFAVFTMIVIGGGISKAISALKKSILLASKGDMTVTFDTRRKDEFMILSNGIQFMMANMRKLIGEVQEIGSKVSSSAGNLSGTCESLYLATRDISQTTSNVEQGIIQQAADAESCLQQMSKLSNQISHVYQSTYEIEQIAGSTKTAVGEGIEIVGDLNDKSKAATAITQEIIGKVQEFEIHSRDIGTFVTTINDIASQTNLLSLNAAIEAARAGESGRGFAVVAEEIRKLADQTMKASDQIQKKVQEILTRTQDTVDTAMKAEEIVGSQITALNKTVMVFDHIDGRVNGLVNSLNDVSNEIKQMESAKEDTLMAIESISAISEQTAASSEEVSTTAQNQLDAVESMKSAAIELAENAQKMEKAISVFKIS